MRVEFAEPGVDPTRIRSEARHSSSKLADVLRGNGLLLLGLVAFLVFSGFQFGLFETKTPAPEAVAAVEVAPTAAAVDTGACLYLDAIVIDEGQTVNVGGTRAVTCRAGQVVVVEVEP